MWLNQSAMLAMCLLFLSSTSANAKARKTVLSFGGNGNIGSEVLHAMFQDASVDYDVVLVSRGSWHFDSAARIQPHVRRVVVCDRGQDAPCAGEADCDRNALRYCPDLMQVVHDTDTFDAVLDFSGYEAKWVRDAVDLLKGKLMGVYIYVSTDSVYEVCQDKDDADRPSVESDAVRPADQHVAEELNRADGYGDAKLAGEEVLRQQREEEGGFPWVALRFADVIGPRDTTYRWMLYQLWVKFYHDINIPVYIPPNVQAVTESLTYVKDAAQAFVLVLDKGPAAWDQAYNIGMRETFTLWGIVERMARLMNITGLEQNNEFHDRSFHLYPSVFKGRMSSEKAETVLGFVPTEADEAFAETIKWYEEAFLHSEDVREEMLSRFITYVVPRHTKDRLYLAVDRELSKAGIVNERFRKKRKGDLGEHEEL